MQYIYKSKMITDDHPIFMSGPVDEEGFQIPNMTDESVAAYRRKEKQKMIETAIILEIKKEENKEEIKIKLKKD